MENLSDKDLKMLKQVIMNLDIYVTDDKYFEMLDDMQDKGWDNWTEDLTGLYNRVCDKLAYARASSEDEIEVVEEGGKWYFV